MREVPETTQVGYEISGNQAFLAARRLVQVGSEGAAQSQHWLVAPLFE